jgi:hypothetical protein
VCGWINEPDCVLMELVDGTIAIAAPRVGGPPYIII